MCYHNSNKELATLVIDVWKDFIDLKECDAEHTVILNGNKGEKKISEIVVPTMPILYFGDYDAYKNSEIKIVTVSLNPSDVEFKQNKNENTYSFFRFPNANVLQDRDSLNNNEVDLYISSLNSYFKIEPYSLWFDDNRRLLFKMLEASYYTADQGNAKNISLHIDLATAIATNPTWGGLGSDTQNVFINSNRGKWRKLLGVLSPDIMLLSLDAKYIKDVDEDLFNKLQENPPERYKEEGNKRKSKYLTCEISLENGKTIKVLDIVTANKAFQFRENGVGHKMFEKILKKWKEEIVCQ